MTVPSDLSGLMLWLDASDSGSITHSGGAVSQWNDLSGNANHAVQATAGAKPTTNSVTLNGLNVLSFDGGDWMVSTAVDMTGGGQAFTAFAVVSITTPSTTQYIAESGSSPGAFAFYNDPANGFAVFKYGSAGHASCQVGALPSSGQSYCVSATHDGALSASESTVWQNGSVGTVRPYDGDTNSNNLNVDVAIGASVAGAAKLTGTIAEVVFYAALLGTSDRQAIESYLTVKWLVAPALPPSHSTTRLQAVNRAGSW